MTNNTNIPNYLVIPDSIGNLQILNQVEDDTEFYLYFGNYLGQLGQFCLCGYFCLCAASTKFLYKYRTSIGPKPFGVVV